MRRSGSWSQCMRKTKGAFHEPPLSRPAATLSPPCGERAGRGVPIWFMAPMRVQILEVPPTHEPRRLRVADLRSGPRLCEAQRFMVPMRAQKRKEAPYEPRSSRREEAHSISAEGSWSLLTSAATVQRFNARNLSGKSLPEGEGERDRNHRKEMDHSQNCRTQRVLRPSRTFPKMTMMRHNFVAALIVSGALALLPGCGRKTENDPPPPPQAGATAPAPHSTTSGVTNQTGIDSKSEMVL